MITRLCRRALLALSPRFSRKTRNSITTRWLRSADRLMADAEAMSPAPLGQIPTRPPRLPQKSDD